MAEQNISPNLNDVEIHNFLKGWSADLDNHAEKPEGYADAWNGRLYSKDGTLAYTSINGTKTVYENQEIIEYQGWWAFKDELIVFAKANLNITAPEVTYVTLKEIVVNDFSISYPDFTIPQVLFDNKFTESEIIVEQEVVDVDNTDFIQNVSIIDDVNVIDPGYDNLFKTFGFSPVTTCAINNNEAPINNEFKDCIISLTFDELGMIQAVFKFIGNLNIPIGAKIVTEGIEENIYYKRVYFSDYYNSTRVVNLKDIKLSKRNPEEFDIQTKGVLLNPRISAVKLNGQLPAMTVFYVMRLVTENGQTSDYSALSKGVKITKGNNEFTFSGGDTSEITNKSVEVKCYIPDAKNFKSVQLVAIEFEAKNVPSAIRLVGTKDINSIVVFEHFGSESEFLENITIADIFANSISWKYNSAFTTKNNKLIVSGLRNDPSFVNSKKIALDFSMNGFKSTGETHPSLLNPDPLNYNYINTSMTESFMLVKRKLFRKIEVFGNFKMELKNGLTGYHFDFSQPKINYTYVDYTKEILAFLLLTQEDAAFAENFPNLKISESNGRILFDQLNPNETVDFYNYDLTYSTSQVIVDSADDIESKEYAWPEDESARETNLVYGAVSNGWFKGNGVRVTMHSVKEQVLSKNTDWMIANGNPLQIKNPSLKKFVMKGEIYRLGIQWFKNGSRLFTTVLGDIKIPDIGEKKRELNEYGAIIYTNENYSNWSVLNNDMFAEGIQLQFDVRVNCELSREADSYQIVYVERTENNRTILAQGFSAPLERIADFQQGGGDDAMGMKEAIIKKWQLPNNGGPVYDENGLRAYDINPDVDNEQNRVVTNRKGFYFDSPDLIYNKISSNFVESCVLEYIETIATDHDRHNIIGGYNRDTCGYAGPNGDGGMTNGNPGTQCYYANGTHDIEGPAPFGAPKFSQKIPSSLLSGDEKTRPFWVNASVFSNRLKIKTYPSFQNQILEEYKYTIDKSQVASPGEILSGYKMNDKFDYANHAFTLAAPGWFFQERARADNNIDTASLWRVHNIAGGRETILIKTVRNFFSNENIAQVPYIINSQVNFDLSVGGRYDRLKGHDAYIVSNLKRNTQDSIYGGRTEFAYASNEYIPLSDVIPVITNRIASQLLYVEGDTYCNLYLRNKSSYQNTEEPIQHGFHWSADSDKNKRKYQYNKYNAWCYAVVLESTIEPRLNNSEEFYKFSKAINFDYPEKYNSAYMQENDLKKSLPKPYNFKDDPILNNIIAASKVKLNGDFIDSWTKFLVNEFYELDKNKGSVLNLAKDNDEVYAIQELQTSKILIDERAFVTPDNDGEAIQIKQGGGNSISGHKVVSEYGTSNRRAVVQNPFGFVFYDERKHEFVKMIEPLFLANNLLLEIKSLFQANKVIDVEGYYDEKFKETNIRFRTDTGVNFVVSYNELLKCFNGKIAYDNHLYMPYQDKVIAPYANGTKLGELNIGEELRFFEEDFNMRLKVISAPNFPDVKINKGIAVYTNIKYPMLKTTFITSLGHIKEILGTHHWYKIREGIHTLPSKNETDYGDIRGEWCSIEIEANSQDNSQVKFFSLLNFFRKSYK